MEPKSNRDNSGKRYVHRDKHGRYARKLEPWEYKPPLWVWVFCVAVVYLIFA
jgi:hypothetical protein